MLTILGHSVDPGGGEEVNCGAWEFPHSIAGGTYPLSWKCIGMPLRESMLQEYSWIHFIFTHTKNAQISEFSILLVARNLGHTRMCLSLSSLGSVAPKNTFLSNSSSQTHWLATSQPLEPLLMFLRVSPGGRDYHWQEYVKSVWCLCFNQSGGPLFDRFLHRQAAPVPISEMALRCGAV